MYPTMGRPAYGVFVQTQMESVARAGADVDVEVVDPRRAPWRYLTAIFRVRKRVRNGEFDLVHAHYGLSGFVAACQPLPLVVSFCGDDLLGTPHRRGGITLKSRVARRLSHLAARRADALICKSEELRAALPRERDRSRAHVLGNGVDVRHFSPGDRLSARRRLGLSVEELLIVFPNDVTQRVKRYDLAQAAVERVRAAGVTARLWVVAGVSYPDMPDHYRAANCLLLTSDHEGSPNVVKEALCCNLPVVTVDAGDVRRWLALAPGCELVERHPEAISQGLRRALEGPGVVDGSRVRSEVALEQVSQRVLAVYRDAVAGRGR